MNEALIQLPELKDVKEMLTAARHDINVEVEEDPELIPLSKLLIQVIDVMEEKIAKLKDLNKLNEREKIDIAAYLNLFERLLEDFFIYDKDEFFEDEFEEEFDEEPTLGK
jgi:hypothetical protein